MISAGWESEGGAEEAGLAGQPANPASQTIRHRLESLFMVTSDPSEELLSAT